LDDLKNVGESNYNPGDGTDQRVQSLVFMMMMINIVLQLYLIVMLIKLVTEKNEHEITHQTTCTFLFLVTGSHPQCLTLLLCCI